jgi:hypothetical protein
MILEAETIECHDKSCSVCKFVADSETVSVNSVSVTDIVQGISRVPFASPAAWFSMQLNCTDTQLVRLIMALNCFCFQNHLSSHFL